MTSTRLRVALAAAMLYGARRFYRNWGTTKDECQMNLPGDELVDPPAQVTTEGVWIDAPASAVWPWLLQIGQGRGGFYTYQRLPNLLGLDYHNADRVHHEWQHLAAGDAVRLAPVGWLGLRGGLSLQVVEVVAQQAIVLRIQTTGRLFDGVWSIHLTPRWDDRCRLLIRTRIPLRRPGAVLAVELAGPVKALMTRGALLGIKRRVEGEIQAEAPAAAASSAHHRAV